MIPKENFSVIYKYFSLLFTNILLWYLQVFFSGIYKYSSLVFTSILLWYMGSWGSWSALGPSAHMGPSGRALHESHEPIYQRRILVHTREEYL